MDDAVQRAEPIQRSCDGQAHVGEAGHVRRHDEHLRAERFDRADRLNLAGDAVVRRVTVEPILPGIAGRRRGTANQHELRLDVAGKPPGDCEPDVAEAAGNQVDAVLAQTADRR